MASCKVCVCVCVIQHNSTLLALWFCSLQREQLIICISEWSILPQHCSAADWKEPIEAWCPCGCVCLWLLYMCLFLGGYKESGGGICVSVSVFPRLCKCFWDSSCLHFFLLEASLVWATKPFIKYSLLMFILFVYCMMCHIHTLLHLFIPSLNWGICPICPVLLIQANGFITTYAVLMLCPIYALFIHVCCVHRP